MKILKSIALEYVDVVEDREESLDPQGSIGLIYPYLR